jgi:hypothetical protein
MLNIDTGQIEPPFLSWEEFIAFMEDYQIEKYDD